MLAYDIILPFESPFASPVVLCRKNNGKNADDPETRRFATDYRKINAIRSILNFRFIPVIGEISANITSTIYMSTLVFTSRYFQIATKLGKIGKAAFIISNGCFTFKRMSFGLSKTLLLFRRP